MACASPLYPSLDEKSQPKSVRRYQIREKIFSIHDNFKIKDVSGEDVFIVRSKLFTIGDKLVLEDITGKALIKIQEDVLHLHRTYNILSTEDEGSSQSLAVVKKKFSLIHPKFVIDSIYGQYSLESIDILAHSFSITKNGNLVATVSKKFFSVADSYGVEIADNENQAFILALVIIIDQGLYDR